MSPTDFRHAARLPNTPQTSENKTCIDQGVKVRAGRRLYNIHTVIDYVTVHFSGFLFSEV